MVTKKIILDGWIYCLSNPCIPKLYKIGMTKKTPEIRAKELYKTGLPEPFVIELAKKVSEPIQKEKMIHKLLSNERHNPSREFFNTDLNKIKNIFSLCDGIIWEPNNVNNSMESESESDIEMNESNEEKNIEQKIKQKKKRKKREYCFENGQRIRHKLVRQGTFWIGKWNTNNNCIECNNIEYKTLTSFAQSHSNIYKKTKNSSINGWKSCECEVISISGKRKWIKCDDYKSKPILKVV